MPQIKPISFHPLGVQFRPRDMAERLNEEVYRSIPALNEMANALFAISSKLSQEARQAMFFAKETDAQLRRLHVEVALVKRESAQFFQPDLEWMNQASPVDTSSFRVKHVAEDFWNERDQKA